MEAVDEGMLYLSVPHLGRNSQRSGRAISGLAQDTTGSVAGSGPPSPVRWKNSPNRCSDRRSLEFDSRQGQAKWKPLPVIDGLLTATALHHHLTVVSRNTADFRRAQVSILGKRG